MTHDDLRCSRRALILAASSLALGGCGSDGEAQVPVNFDGLVSSNPFYVAHRGGSSNWPEMTLDAYQHAVDCGIDALEVSVQRSADGVFVACHNPTTEAITGVDLTIATTPWSQLKSLKVRGPDGQSAPLARLDDVLERYAATKVLFVEDKTYRNTEGLLGVMSRSGSPDHFVWKVSGTAADGFVTPAARAGYPTWGYYFREDISRYTASASRFTWTGIDYNCTDAEIARAMAFGKPMIGHIVSTSAQQVHLLRGGCQGIMLANVLGLAPRRS